MCASILGYSGWIHKEDRSYNTGRFEVMVSKRKELCLQHFNVFLLSRRDYATAKGSDDYNHLQEQYIITFSSWTEICNTFHVSIATAIHSMQTWDSDTCDC